MTEWQRHKDVVKGVCGMSFSEIKKVFGIGVYTDQLVVRQGEGKTWGEAFQTGYVQWSNGLDLLVRWDGNGVDEWVDPTKLIYFSKPDCKTWKVTWYPHDKDKQMIGKTLAEMQKEIFSEWQCVIRSITSPLEGGLNEILDKFREKMQEELNLHEKEKDPPWNKVSPLDLMESMMVQIAKMKIGFKFLDKEEVTKRTVHVANYCMFIWTLLESRKE